MNILLRGRWDQWLRLASGLILFAFVLTHFANHALGLISIGAMDWFQTLRWSVTRSQPGKIVLIAAILTHVGLAISKLATRTTWRMPLWEAVQIFSGLAIPFLLIPHVVGTRFAAEIFGLKDYYLYALVVMWPNEAINIAILMTLVWVHACVGLHFWLRLTPLYLRLQPVLLTFATALPLLAYSGFTVAGRAADLKAAQPGAMAKITKQLRIPDAEAFVTLANIADMMRAGFAVIIGLLLLTYVIRKSRALTQQPVKVSYVQGPDVRAKSGPTLLEISRQNNVPHTSVCGGRARCSTCRVRVDRGLDLLAPAGAAEQRTLDSINADPQVRLACQIRPVAPMTVLRLVKATEPGALDQVSVELTSEDTGVERDLVVMFMDVRGFTRWSEGKLPYDVVFLLNEFFDAASKAVEAEGGWIDKYMGDGMMAVFGRTVEPEQAARQALRAAARIDRDLSGVGDRLSAEVGETVRIGMGLHAGTVVLGRIGYGGAAALTVIGEAVNTASRLEGLTSKAGQQLIISRRVADLAGQKLAPDTISETEIRGLKKPVEIYGFTSASAAMV